MATIQVRELPQATYEVLRRRARLAGKSLQAYMCEQLVALAARPTKDEALAAIEAVQSRMPDAGSTAAPVLQDLAADRR